MLARAAIPLPLRWRLWRWSIPALVLLALVGARGAMLEGLWTPVRITGPSMAPALTGEQTLLNCQACRFSIAFDATAPASRVVCPNCGHLQTDDAATHTSAGQRVLIDRWPLLWRAPQRMELVAWETETGLAVKRVIGLPGEQIAIRDGELYRNEQLWQKTLDEQRALGQLVHDDRYTADGQSPWQAEPRDAARFNASQATHSMSASTDIAWLNFHPPALQLIPSAAKQAQITDIDLCNPANSRTINDVFDVRITGRIELDAPAQVIWRLNDGWHEWRIEWNHTEFIAHLYRDEKHLGLQVNLRPAPATDRSALDFEVALCDQQIILVIDGQTCFEHSYTVPATPRELGDSTAISIGTPQANAKIKNLRVYRDIYWLDPPGLNRPWQATAPLRDNEYFLLGDNVPVSTDSRHLGPASRNQLRGVVQAWE